MTVSPLHIDSQRWLTIVLRDIALRQHAESELKRLRSKNERLHELVRAQSQTADIIGEFKAMTDVPLPARGTTVTRKDGRQSGVACPNDITRHVASS